MINNYKPPRKITVLGDNSDCGITASCPLCYYLTDQQERYSYLCHGKHNALYCNRGHKLTGKDNDYNKAIIAGYIKK